MNAAAVVPRFRSVQRILFAVDFSEASQHVAPAVRNLVTLYGADLLVAHVVEPSTPPHGALNHSDGARELAQQHMDRFMASEAMRGLSFQTMLRTGELCPVLSDVVERNGIDLVVAGIHGRGWLGKLVLGSSAEMLVRHAPCPVMTVGPAVPKAWEGQFLRILFPTDTRGIPAHALPYAVRLANEHNAQIVFTHVLHRDDMPLDYPDEEPIDDERYARAMYWMSHNLIAPAGDFRRQPELMVESGVAADRIVEVARQVGADVIVMPVRRSRAHGRPHAPWSTAYRILAHADCPVITVTE
jgi:nucleotide-binding universal stress UspA family protein